jgi:hypothetical protein
LDKTIKDSELGFGPSYNIHRRDRDHNTSLKSRGGGVLIASSRKLQGSTLKTLNKSIEQVFVMLRAGETKIILGTVYLPPSSNKNLYELHGEDLEQLRSRYNTANFIIAGDYNLPGARWRTDGAMDIG